MFILCQSQQIRQSLLTVQRGRGTWGSLSGGGSRVREWCPLALDTSRSWGCCTAEPWRDRHTESFLLTFSALPSSFQVAEWLLGTTDSKRAIPIDLMSHHCPFPKALTYIQQHPMNPLLGPRDPVIFPPHASPWISFIAHSFTWSSNNSLCSLHIPQSPLLWRDTVHKGNFQGNVWMSFHCLSSSGKSAAGEAVRACSHSQAFLFLPGGFCPQLEKYLHCSWEIIKYH